jgi:hypothetical protein
MKSTAGAEGKGWVWEGEMWALAIDSKGTIYDWDKQRYHDYEMTQTTEG